MKFVLGIIALVGLAGIAGMAEAGGPRLFVVQQPARARVVAVNAGPRVFVRQVGAQKVVVNQRRGLLNNRTVVRVRR